MTKLEIFIDSGGGEKTVLVFKAAYNPCQAESELTVELTDKDGNTATVDNIPDIQIRQIVGYLNAGLPDKTRY